MPTYPRDSINKIRYEVTSPLHGDDFDLLFENSNRTRNEDYIKVYHFYYFLGVCLFVAILIFIFQTFKNKEASSSLVNSFVLENNNGDIEADKLDEEVGRIKMEDIEQWVQDDSQQLALSNQQSAVSPSISKPRNLVTSKPRNLVTSKPRNLVTSKPRNLVTSKPRNLVTSKPRNLVTSKPRNLVTSKPRNLVTSKPQMPKLVDIPTAPKADEIMLRPVVGIE